MLSYSAAAQEPGAAGKSKTAIPEALARQFDYDPKAPLDAQDRLLQTKDKVELHDITYVSPKGGRVPAYLVVPADKKGPFAGIVFGHWGPGNRTEFLAEAMHYAQAGAVSILIDYPWTRPAPWRRDLPGSGEPEKEHEAYMQAVVDLRRAMDLLLMRADVDPKRIAYVGHSFGAQWGAVLCAVDRRMKGAVLMGGIPDRAAIYLESDDSELVEWRKTTPQEKKDKFFDIARKTDAIQYIAHAAPIPLLFQFARFERFFTEAGMKRYYQAASQPKEVRWYDTGHELNDPQALLDRSAWLAKLLRIGL